MRLNSNGITVSARIETLPDYNEYVLDLVARAGRGDRTPEMELIAQSISSAEPGGGHMIDLVRALLNGPVGDGRPEASRA